MKNIIIDTNVFMLLIKKKTDIFEEIKTFCHFPITLYVADRSIEELKMIKGSKLALDIITSMIKKNHLKILLMDNRHVDFQLLEAAAKGFIVCTQDKELKRRLKSIKASYMTFKEGRRVALFT